LDLTFYATLDASTLKPYLPNLPYLLPLASWWRRDVQLKRPPRLPAHLTHVAVDCGSYTLAQHQVQPGFHFTAEQYAAWIRALGPAARWAVLPDWPCEGASAPEVRRRQIATTVTAVDVLSNHLDVPWCWCPVLQGQRVEVYLRHAIDVAAWVYELHEVYAARGQAEAFRVCLGSLCRRNSVAEIRNIVSSVARVLPKLVLHLFGVKLSVLQQTGDLPDAVVSVDSAAWTSRFGRHINVAVDEQRRTCVRCKQVAPRPRMGAPPGALDVVIHWVLLSASTACSSPYRANGRNLNGRCWQEGDGWTRTTNPCELPRPCSARVGFRGQPDFRSRDSHKAQSGG
jgi:hypothetical protein